MKKEKAVQWCQKCQWWRAKESGQAKFDVYECNGEKECVTLCLSFKVAVYKASRLWCNANVGGKKKKSDQEAKKK